MSCVVQWWHVLFVKDMHFSSKNARLLNFIEKNCMLQRDLNSDHWSEGKLADHLTTIK